LRLLDNYDEYEHINCGAGSETTIRDLAQSVGRVTGFTGKIVLDATKPDGAPRKLMDSSKIRALGWKPEIALDDGIAGAYRWFLEKRAGDISLRQDTYVA